MTVLVIALGWLLTGVLGVAALSAPARVRARRLRTARRAVLPDWLRGRLEVALARADVDLAPEEAVRWSLVATGAATLVAAAWSPALSLPAAVVVLGSGPVALRAARTRADRRAAVALPGALDRLAAGLRAGGTVTEMLTGLATLGGPLGSDLRRAAARLRLGVGLADALGHWRRERPLPGVHATAGALALAAGSGGASAQAIEGLASSLRGREAAVRDAWALSAQARVSAVVVGAAPAAYLAFATITDPGSLDVLLGSNLGRLCLGIGLGLEGLAVLWMRSLVRARS